MTKRTDNEEQDNKISIEEILKGVDYRQDALYIPTEFAIKLVNLIKLISDGEGEENKSPTLHYKVLDTFATDPRDVINLIFRGAAKTTLIEFLIWYCAIYGELPQLGKLNLALYVSDTIENGVATMHNNLVHRYENSEFLKKYLKAKLTRIRWEFSDLTGRKFIVKAYGAATGIRGVREQNQRPQLALLDDLMSDEVAKSPAASETIKNTVNKAVEFALHPTRRRVIWCGTPFNKRDPIYTAVESGAYAVNVFPVCNQFPCAEGDFVSAWPDRFTYQAVLRAYRKALDQGEIASFNQELMLRIRSDEDKLIHVDNIPRFELRTLIKNKEYYNFYITTDFAMSERQHADFSVICVWALNSAGAWHLVDGICERQKMADNIDDLFRLVQRWKPLSVGIEVTGQQVAFISWIENEMIKRNIHFAFASNGSEGSVGIRPTANKFSRFMLVTPLFNQRRIKFAQELENTPLLREAIEELDNATVGGFKSAHDDVADNISMLPELGAFPPMYSVPVEDGQNPSRENDVVRDIWAEAEHNNNDDVSGLSSYTV